ncbi:MAG: sensor histidine kinase, partial [Anaerolineales bacterium]
QVAVLHDVTHFKELEHVKNEFIASASHDLKNPITTVLAYSELLEKVGPLNAHQADFVSRIQRASHQMHELVLNLLELARADLGMELKLESCDLSQLLISIADEFQPQASAKAQSLQVKLPEGLPAISADGVRLRQVVRNLVGNAIKYTPNGGQVTLSAEIQAQAVRFSVQDTGPGISASDLTFIFDKFYRVQSDATQDIEGNGLGLAIVKSIVEQHGGEVAVTSTPGHGTHFSFTLPLTPRPMPTPVEHRAGVLL